MYDVRASINRWGKKNKKFYTTLIRKTNYELVTYVLVKWNVIYFRILLNLVSRSSVSLHSQAMNSRALCRIRDDDISGWRKRQYKREMILAKSAWFSSSSVSTVTPAFASSQMLSKTPNEPGRDVRLASSTQIEASNHDIRFLIAANCYAIHENFFVSKCRYLTFSGKKFSYCKHIKYSLCTYI